jgi:hypothetical protein
VSLSNGHAELSSFRAAKGTAGAADACAPWLWARTAASGFNNAVKVRLRVRVRVKYLLIMG